MKRERYNAVKELMERAGMSWDDAHSLRRIAMTLHRWHELECGDSNNWASWAIERDGNEDDSPPYMVTYPHSSAKSQRRRIPDRENGAKKRLAAILAKYPSLQSYIQGDPRGCPLYIIRPGDVPPNEPTACYYNRGIAVCA